MSYLLFLKRHNKLKARNNDSIVTTALLLFVGLFMVTFAVGYYLIVAFNPREFVLYDAGFITFRLIDPYQTLVFTGLYLRYMSSVMLSLSWIDVVYTFRVSLYRKKSLKIRLFRRFIIFLTVFLMILGLSLKFSGFDSNVLNTIYTPVIGMIVIIVFIVGGCLFTNLIKKVQDKRPSKDANKSIIKLVRRSCILHIIDMILRTIVIITFWTYQFDFYSIVSVGGFNYHALRTEVVILFGHVVNLYDLFYIRRILNGLRTKHRTPLHQLKPDL